MSDPRDKKSDGKEPEAADGKRSGRVAFDSRGNSVWEWQVKTGVYSRDVNTESVRKLELDDLSLEDSAIRKADDAKRSAPPARSTEPASEPPTRKIDSKAAGGGFNPYDNAASHKRSGGIDPYDSARLRAESLKQSSASAPTAQQSKPAAARKPVAITKAPPREMHKLSGWLKLKQALLGKKRTR